MKHQLSFADSEYQNKPLYPTMVQPERSCYGGRTLRNCLDEAVCKSALDGAIPDHTTIMNFRHLLERHSLAQKIFKEVNHWLSEAGLLTKKVR